MCKTSELQMFSTLPASVKYDEISVREDYTIKVHSARVHSFQLANDFPSSTPKVDKELERSKIQKRRRTNNNIIAHMVSFHEINL